MFKNDTIFLWFFTDLNLGSTVTVFERIIPANVVAGNDLLSESGKLSD